MEQSMNLDPNIFALHHELTTLKVKTLKCEMRDACMEIVTHIDENGFIYCQCHGDNRKASMRCRKLTADELKTLLNGQPITRY